MRIQGLALQVIVTLSVLAQPGSGALANSASTTNTGAIASNLAAPAPQPSPSELALATRYADGMEGMVEALEKVIEAQANQINMISWMVAVFGIALTLAGLGLYRKLKSTVEDAVDERVTALVTTTVDVNNTRSAKLHAAFLETTFSASRDLALSRERDLLARISSGEFDLSTPEGARRLVRVQSEVLLFPISVVSTIYGLTAGDEDGTSLREKVWVLFAEVAARNITPRAMLPLITALIDVLHHRKTRPEVLSSLRAFAKQLREAIELDVLPDAPNF